MKTATKVPWNLEKWHEQKIEPVSIEEAKSIVRRKANPFARNERIVFGQTVNDAGGVNNPKTCAQRRMLPYFIFNDSKSYVLGNREYLMICRVSKNVPWSELEKIGKVTDSQMIHFYHDGDAPYYAGKKDKDRYRAILIYLNRNFNTQFWI